MTFGCVRRVAFGDPGCFMTVPACVGVDTAKIEVNVIMGPCTYLLLLLVCQSLCA